jgi:predicted AAA+ superfamily ATPase
VDFVATDFAGGCRLIQVAADISAPATFEREIRGLSEARQEFPDAAALLVSETDPPPGTRVPNDIEILPVWQWLLT